MKISRRTLGTTAAALLLVAACTDSGAEGPTASGVAGCPTAQPAALGAGEQREIVMTTSLGEITLLLEADLSPIAVGNFVALAECGGLSGGASGNA